MDAETSLRFRQWFKAQRKALDLTQEALAERVGCSWETVRKIEAGKQRPSRQLAELLADALQLPADRRAAFVQLARKGSDQPSAGSGHKAAPAWSGPTSPVMTFPVPRSTVPGAPVAPSPPANLPLFPTSFIGREQEIQTVLSLLRQPDVRLLSLTGPGGIGKTRLAVQAAAKLFDSFAHGVFFVSLAPLRDPGLVAAAIAHAVAGAGTPPQEPLARVKQALHHRRVLLVLDNFEHLLPAGMFVSELIAALPGLKMLVTSRERLHLYGEYEFQVPPLRTPDPTALPAVDDPTPYDAVELFVRRAVAAQPDFALTGSNSPAIVEITCRLEGNALAIELAAAHVKLFEPRVLLQRLRRRLALLMDGPRDVPARQRTLRATIEWSYNLLAGEEQQLFRRLAVFHGGCTLEAVEAVCNSDGVLAGAGMAAVAALVDKSLLNQEQGSDGEPRFRMLETIREYAQERLEESGEVETLRRRHAHVFATLAGQHDLRSRKTPNESWIDWLEAEQDNLRAAVRWALEQGEEAAALRLALGLCGLAQVRGSLGEGLRWAEAVLAQSQCAGGDLRATLMTTAAWMHLKHGDSARAGALAEASLALYSDAADVANVVLATITRACVLFGLGKHSEAVALVEESLARTRPLGNAFLVFRHLNILGLFARWQGDYERATQRLEEGLAVAQTMENPSDAPLVVLGSLGELALDQGDPRLAAGRFLKMLLMNRDGQWSQPAALGLTGLVKALTGLDAPPQRVLRLAGAASALLETAGLSLDAEAMSFERVVTQLHPGSDEPGWKEAWRAGRGLTFDQAILEVLALATEFQLPKHS